MFREMRRKKQLLSREECDAVLNRGSCGVLALEGDEGYPYAVPISYVYDEGKLFFHCAKSGHKLDAIRQNPKASFCVVDQDQIVPEEYTTYFKSVIVFGRIRILEQAEEKYRAIEKLAVKYAPEDTEQNRRQAIERDLTPLCMLEMTAEHITGKQAKELAKAQPQKE